MLVRLFLTAAAVSLAAAPAMAAPNRTEPAAEAPTDAAGLRGNYGYLHFLVPTVVIVILLIALTKSGDDRVSP